MGVMTPRGYVSAVRILGVLALFAILAVAVVSHHFDGRPTWCPSDTATAQCADLDHTAAP
ncbi:hypothetical protein AERO9AM_50023 [Aeromicrobium sp. 9AM]|nr:hypothetical protein AERO9AM_50023 [Aeromicrobium sp. 9AM]